MEIDPQLLPSVAFLDTGVLMRAVGENDDPDAPACAAFWSAMLRERRQMLCSAVTLAELLRTRPVVMPRVRGFAIVGFDERAAAELGARLPNDVLKSVTGGALTVSYLKFDALIVASALRYRADVLVTLDTRLHPLTTRVGLRCAAPSEFQKKQLSLRVGDGNDE